MDIPDVDGDMDGISDENDLCARTPFDEVPNDRGCSCSQLDDDLDSVNNCDDRCIMTPLFEEVDEVGCVQGPGPITINLCGVTGTLPLLAMLSGLCAIRNMTALRGAAQD